MMIFAVEDEPSISELYTYSLSSAGMDVRCFESGAPLFDALKTETPDLIILDIMLDGMDGYEILSRLKGGKFADIPVMMISAKGGELSKVKGLDLGADDYMSKPFGVLELISRIKANTRKNKKAAVSGYKDIVINDDTHTLTVCGQEQPCTLKIYELMKFLVAKAGTVAGRGELLSHVWGEGYEGETRTLDMHVADARKLLAAGGSGAEIVTVRGVGYILK